MLPNYDYSIILGNVYINIPDWCKTAMNYDALTFSKTVIFGEDYYTLKLFNEYIGKCVISKKNENGVLLKYIEITAKFRKMGLSTYFWNYVENDLIQQKKAVVTLIAEEKDDGYNKLVKLYQSWGFTRLDNKERFIYNADICIRQVKMQKKLRINLS